MPEKNVLLTEYAANLIEQGYSPEEVQNLIREQHMAAPNITRTLSDLIDRSGMTMEQVAGFAGVNPATIFKILKRTLNPSRNILIRIAFSLRLSMEDTQSLLKAGNCSQLSGSRERDLIIMEGIIHKRNLEDVNEILYDKKMLSLYSKG